MTETERNPVVCEVVDQVALLRVDAPPVNALSHVVRSGLADALAKAHGAGVTAAVILCEGRTFFAGADIREFGKPPKSPVLGELLQQIEASTIPVVAAMHGNPLGGGLELAMACHYRIALQGTQMGLPEVNLGLMPGAGGTQRLPRLVGLEEAAQIMLSGQPVSAQHALEIGLVDRVCETELPAQALAFAQELDAPRPTGLRAMPVFDDQPDLLSRLHAMVQKKYRGLAAQASVLECLEVTQSLPIDEALKEERQRFLQLVQGPQSSALRYQFFAERQAGRAPQDAHVGEIRSTAVVGAGTMGSGIAISLIDAGFPVHLLEIDGDALRRGLQRIDDHYRRVVDGGYQTAAAATAARGRLTGTTRYTDLADSDLVIEAAFEDLEVKRTIFTALDEHCKASALLASNTSYLDIDALGRITSRPTQVLGLHFFSPAERMKLLEVIRTGATSDAALATALAFARKIGKLPVTVGVCYGFAANRTYAAYNREVQNLLLEGAGIEQVDAAMREFGMAMGPCAVTDLTGIDIGVMARRAQANRPDDPRYFAVSDALYNAGLLGRKSGEGFYCYGNTRGASTQAQALIDSTAQGLGITRRAMDADTIVGRLLRAIQNEAEHAIAEGIVERESDIDIIWCNGYGFPRHLGGPMYQRSLSSEGVT